MDLAVWQLLVLAAIQGVAEFLPVSSSGHVVILAHLMGANFDLVELNVAMHVGTLLSILVVYASRIRRLLGTDRGMIGPLAVATLPAAALGLAIKQFEAESVLESPLLAGVCLVVTGVILLLTRWLARPSDQSNSIPPRTAWAVGFAQALAVLPGISRSGATISAGIACGLPPRRATTFSFLMAIPIIAGAGALQTFSYLRGASSGGDSATTTAPVYLLLCASVACLVGILSLWWLERWVERGRFHWFAWWCIPVGVAVIIWQLFFAP